MTERHPSAAQVDIRQHRLAVNAERGLQDLAGLKDNLSGHFLTELGMLPHAGCGKIPSTQYSLECSKSAFKMGPTAARNHPGLQEHSSHGHGKHGLIEGKEGL